MDIQTYLDRINFSTPVRPAYETLRRLQFAHLLAVPFENLDIVPLHRPIHLNEHALWEKIIVHKRGGFCYELNGLFARLLAGIGFEVTYLNACVFTGQGKLGREFDHLALMVRIPGQSGRWLADVGFGDSFMEPLNLETMDEQPQGSRAYKLERITTGLIVWQLGDDQVWQRQYSFDLHPRKFPHDYEAACYYHQTSPESSFTHKGVISILTAVGRATLEESRLILTTAGTRLERSVTNADEYKDLLKVFFGVQL